MKKILLLSLASLFLAFSVKAQQTNITVAIAKKSTSCNSTDLGYQVYYGADYGELRKGSSAAVKRLCPDWEHVETKNNEDWGSYMGSYLVIISATVTNSSGCQRSNYGVGFGTSSSAALKDAKKHLTGRNWSWSEGKHGYKVEAEKRY